jgi:hypothetical protein
MITNKSLPLRLFIPSEDENDAAVNIWGSVPGIERQKIITRNKVDEFLPSWYSMKTRIIKQRIVY